MAAVWQLEGGPAQTISMGVLQALEVTSDSNGRFRVPGWGPRFNFGWGSVYDSQPTLFIVRTHYLPVVVSSPRWTRPLFILRRADKLIQLVPIREPKELTKELTEIRAALMDAFWRSRPCRWGSIPLTREMLFHRYDNGAGIGDAGGPFPAPKNLAAQPCNWFIDLLGGAV